MEIVIIWIGFIVIGWIYNVISKYLDEKRARIRDEVANELAPKLQTIKVIEEYKLKLESIGYKRFNTEHFVDGVLKRETYRSRIKCTNCDGYLSLRDGKYGKFFGCSNYPKCNATINLKEGKTQIKDIVSEEFIQDFTRAYS